MGRKVNDRDGAVRAVFFDVNNSINADTPMKKNVHIFVPPLDDNMVFLPMTWAMLKTYYDHRGKHADRFHWPEPMITGFTVDEITKHLAANPPDVFGFGGYIWNIDLCYQVAKLVKATWPTCLVVAGGPQPEYQSDRDWFKNHPFIDIVVPRDGEVPFTAILDRVAENKKNFMTVPDIVLPGADGVGITKSLVSSDLRDFTWPASAVLHESTTLQAMIAENKKNQAMTHVLLETARGCPYQCTFCDWGGGTYTKVRCKPVEMVKQEIDWLAENKVDYVTITDANVGMFPRDVELMTYLANKKQKTGWPTRVKLSNAKQNADRTIQITKILFDAGLISEYLLALQDTDGDVLKHIKRIDLSWDKNVERAQTLQSHGIPVSLVLISGLPGWNTEKFFSNVDHILDSGLNYPKSYPFLLLPNSPAAEPTYRQEHDIRTVRRYMDTYPVILRKHVKATDMDMASARVTKDHNNGKVDFVISTKWYTTEEMLRLRLLNAIVFMGETTGALRVITRQLRRHTQLSYSEIYRCLADEFFSDQSRCGQTWSVIYANFVSHFQQWLVDDQCYWEVDPPLDDDFPFALPTELYWSFHAWVYHAELFAHLKGFLRQKFNLDMDEVCDFNHFLMITPDYEPDKVKSRVFSRNWMDHDCVTTPITITVHDLVYNDKNQKKSGRPIDWHHCQERSERILQWFYQVMYGVKHRRWHLDFDIIQEQQQ